MESLLSQWFHSLLQLPICGVGPSAVLRFDIGHSITRGETAADDTGWNLPPEVPAMFMLQARIFNGIGKFKEQELSLDRLEIPFTSNARQLS